MNKNQIINLSQLQEMGIKLARLDSNREINEAAIEKKARSIKTAGIICPSIITPAKNCLDEGLKVSLFDNTQVTAESPDLDNIYVILEGQHRYQAICKLNDDLKEGEERFEDYFMQPLSGKASIVDILREANTTTFPWKDRDYMKNLCQAQKGQKMELLNEILRHKKASTKASLHYLSLNKERNLYSRQIVAAMQDENKLADICEVNPNRFGLGRKLFTTISEVLGEEEAGKVVYPDWCISLLEKNTDKSLDEMIDKLCEFFRGFNETTADEFKAMKRDSKQNISRDERIKAKLNELYAEFEAND